MAAARRFVFVERIKSGAERLMLANLETLPSLAGATARVVAQMGAVPGDTPRSGEIPETYAAIAVRPDSAFVAALSAQTGTDFIDFNISIHDMRGGAQTVRFNEHSITGVNRANCPCPLFDAFLAAEAASGVPQSQIDSYDYTIIVEGTGVGTPRLAWSTSGTLIATFGFDVVADGAFLLGQDQFAIEVAPTAPPGGGVSILSRNAGIAPAPVPRNSFSVRPVSVLAMPPGPNVIHHGKRPVRFWPWPHLWKILPRWFGGLFPGLAVKPAERVQGFV